MIISPFTNSTPGTAIIGEADDFVMPLVEREPMTVVCALQDEDCLYLAADSAVTGLPTKGSATKIDHVTSLPLAWASSGDEAIGLQFGRQLKQWLAEADADELTWEKFVNVCVTLLAELNGVRRKVASLNSVGFNISHDFAEIMLVGFIGGVPEIAHLEQRGDWNLHLLAGRHFATIGSGSDHAAMAYEVLKENGLLPANGEAAISAVMDLAVRHAPNCEPPIHVWRVDRSGAAEINV